MSEPESGLLGILAIALMWAPLICVGWGPDGFGWQLLTFACCLLAAVAFLISVPGAFVIWSLAWIFSAAARSAANQRRADKHTHALLREQNELLRKVAGRE
jgi:hypothetical protein